MTLSFGNLVGSVGGLMGRGGAAVGRLGANLDRGIANTASRFFQGAISSATPKAQPQDAPVPTGIANFRANDPSTYSGTTSGSIGTSKVTPKSQPQTATNAGTLGSSTLAPASSSSSPNPINTGTNTGYVNSNGVYVSSNNNGQPYFTAGTTSPGGQPSTSSNNPYINSLNTQQSYASGSGNSAVNAATGTLQGIATRNSPEVEQQIRNIQGLQNAQNDIANNPNVAAEVASGRGQAVTGEISAAQNALQNTLAQQGQQITAANQAGSLAQGQQSAQQSSAANVGSLTQPQAGAAFFGSPVSGNTVGNGVGGSDLVNNAVNQAVQIANSGADPAAIESQLQSQYGAPSVQAFRQAMLNRGGGQYNPTASSAAANQNATQGAAYQGQAAQLSTTLKQLDTLTPTVTNFLNASGLNNSSSPLFNKSINAYIQQAKNPADIASLNAMLADVKTYTAQILGSSGLNPTEVSATVNSFDPAGLNAEQLTAFLKNLSNLGQTRLAPLQQTAGASYGNTAVQPYAGQQANPSVNSTLGPITTGSPASNIKSPVIQALLGGGINAAGGIESAISGIASRILQ